MHHELLALATFYCTNTNPHTVTDNTHCTAAMAWLPRAVVPKRTDVKHTKM
jgi:hypothetical protein